MKLFIWEDVLRNYTSGMAVAYAETLEEAIESFGGCIDEDQLGRPTKVIDCATDKTPFGTYVWGGG